MDVELRVWPCGCVTVLGEPIPHAEWHIAYECKWCGAVTSRADLITWFSFGEFLPAWITQRFIVARLQDDIVEVRGVCLDGHPVIRHLKHGAKDEYTHAELEPLRN